MVCSKCGRSYRIGAKFCQHCGAAIASSAASPSSIGDDLGRLADQLTSSLRAESAELSRGLTERSKAPFGALGVSPASSSALRAVAPAAPALGDAAERFIRSLLTPTAAELDQCAGFMFKSPFIQSNSAYRQRVDRISFLFEDQEWEVNAFAMDHPYSSKKGVLAPPVICFMAGLGTAIRFAAMSLSAQLVSVETRSMLPGVAILVEAFRAFGEAVIQTRGKFTVDAAFEVFVTHVVPALRQVDEHSLSLSRSYAMAMESFVIAHEAGHLALSHTLGSKESLDVSRNQEREADSFAASTLSSCPFRDYLFLGSVFVTILFIWMEEAGGRHSASTHPLGRERFENALRSNSAAAAEAAERFGFTRERLLELLPPQ